MLSDDDCCAIVSQLYRFLDGECTEQQADEIRAHLDICDHCAEDADAVIALKGLVKRCCAEPAAPPELRARIVMRYRSSTFTQIGYTEIWTEG